VNLYLDDHTISSWLLVYPCPQSPWYAYVVYFSREYTAWLVYAEHPIYDITWAILPATHVITTIHRAHYIWCSRWGTGWWNSTFGVRFRQTASSFYMFSHIIPVDNASSIHLTLALHMELKGNNFVLTIKLSIHVYLVASINSPKRNSEGYKHLKMIIDQYRLRKGYRIIGPEAIVLTTSGHRITVPGQHNIVLDTTTSIARRTSSDMAW
jgi:hypothetical protein